MKKLFFYRSFSEELKEHFGEKVYKVTLDGGFTCPNRDGSKAIGGCTFCDEDGSGPGMLRSVLSVSRQIDEGKLRMFKRYNAKKFIAYFQAYTGTYAKSEQLKKLFDEALNVKDVVGLSVATRPDCLDEEVLDLLETYHQKTYFWLEIGLQSTNDEALRKVNRGHDLDCFMDALERAKRRNLRICAHFIIGLPGDTREHLLEGAKLVQDKRVEGVKIHHLHILKSAPMEKLWEQGLIKVLSLDEYASLAVDFLERIPKEVIIQRLAGSSPKEKLLAPLWTLNRTASREAILKEFKRRGSYQGALCH